MLLPNLNFCVVIKRNLAHVDRSVAVGADLGMQGGAEGPELAGNAADGHEFCRRFGNSPQSICGQNPLPILLIATVTFMINCAIF